MHANKRLVTIGSLLLVAVWAAWCVYFLPRGIAFFDEGLYLSEAWRLAQGDLLFRDAAQSATTLSFWWVSWVFRIHPECGFLGVRIIWAITMLLCALVTANLMLRYFNPLVSFTGAAASLFFVDGVTTLTSLNYNTMPALPLLLAAWLWLAACRRSGKLQLFLGAGAGAAAFLATTCKITIVIIIFLPILTLVYDRCCGVKTDGLWRAAIGFFTTYFAGVVLFFLAVGSLGLIGDLFNGWTLATTSGGHRLDQLTHMMISSSLFILSPGLVVLLIAAFFRYRENLIAFSIRHKEAVKRSIPVIVASMLLIAILVWFYLHELDGFQYMGLLVARLITRSILVKVTWLLFLLATGVILADVMFRLSNHVFNLKTEEDMARTHDRCRVGIMAIFLCLVVILGTNELPARTAWLSAWLVISLAVGLCCVWFADRTKYLTNPRFVWRRRAVCIVFLLLFPSYGILRDVSPYGDSPVWELSVSPKTPRIHGILTTPERADFIDSVVDSVERNSEVGDRILVYYNMPIFYYLTGCLPSTKLTWLGSCTQNADQQSLVEDMIERDRVPKVVVYCPWIHQPSDDPIHEYVEEHYEVVQKVSEPSKVKVAIYADNSGEPGHRLSANNSSTLVTAGWNEISIPPTFIVKHTYYWLAIVSNENVVCCEKATGNRRYKSANYHDWTWPKTAGGGWSTVTDRTAAIAGWAIPPQKLVGADDTACDVGQCGNYPSLWRFQAVATGSLNTFRLKACDSGNYANIMLPKATITESKP